MRVLRLNYLTSALLFGIFLCIGWLDVATAGCRRSCDAYYELTPQVGGASTVLVGHFTTRAGCGCSVPNRCRRRARNGAHECMKTHWNQRNSNTIPGSCVPGVGRVNSTYPITNLDTYLRRQIDLIYGGRRDMVVRVQAKTAGNTGCPMTVPLGFIYIR